MDGYSCYVNITSAIKIFVGHKILIIKKEADSSATNQPYDQLFAKKEKSILLPLVDLFSRLHGVIDQFKPINLMIQALKIGDLQNWVKSFIGVNIHSKHRLTFED